MDLRFTIRLLPRTLAALSGLLVGGALVATARAQQQAPVAAGSLCALDAKALSQGTGFHDACDVLTVRNLAQAGHVYEENQMGMVSALVVDRQHDLRDARHWFEKAARHGYAPAQVNLAVMYIYGWGVPRNYGTALYWLKMAQKENARAQADLGILYLNGWGIRQSNSEALRLFSEAANADDTVGMVNLGYMLDQGLGVAQDRIAAAEWYRKASDRGEPLAQSNLADMYLRGEGMPQNDLLALDLFQKAASAGSTPACIKLGYLYLTGRGTKPDAETAYAWIASASLAGDHRGDEYLPAAEKQLSAEQLDRARRRAREFRAKSQTLATEIAFLP